VKYFPNSILGYFTQLLDWVNRTKANQPAFGYALADLPGNVIWAIRLSAKDVDVTPIRIMRLTIQVLTARHRRLNVAWYLARELVVPVPDEALE
jgi:hypothetical protein